MGDKELPKRFVDVRLARPKVAMPGHFLVLHFMPFPLVLVAVLPRNLHREDAVLNDGGGE